MTMTSQATQRNTVPRTHLPLCGEARTGKDDYAFGKVNEALRMRLRGLVMRL